MPQDTNNEAVVYIVVDDGSVRFALDCPFRSVGLQTRSHGSAQEFFETKPADCPGCIVLDVRLPGMSGFDSREKLADLGNRLPVILITAHGDIPVSVRAMTRGAINFLPRPFRDQDVLDAQQRSNVIVSRETLTAILQEFADRSSRYHDYGGNPDVHLKRRLGPQARRDF